MNPVDRGGPACQDEFHNGLAHVIVKLIFDVLKRHTGISANRASPYAIDPLI